MIGYNLMDWIGVLTLAQTFNPSTLCVQRMKRTGTIGAFGSMPLTLTPVLTALVKQLLPLLLHLGERTPLNGLLRPPGV